MSTDDKQKSNKQNGDFNEMAQNKEGQDAGSNGRRKWQAPKLHAYDTKNHTKASFFAASADGLGYS